MDFELLHRLCEIDERRGIISSEDDDLKEERRKIEINLLDAFQTEGVSNVKLNGRTVFLHRQLWAKPKEEMTRRLVRVLRAIGLAELVKTSVNSQSLSAYCREQELEGGIRPCVSRCIETTEVFSIRSRRGA